jgi:hypothetical protein
MENKAIEWLLTGDIAIRYQTTRDLMSIDRSEWQQRIHIEGWGKRLLDLQSSNGHWGIDWYRPKWICTHYTLLIFKHLQPIKAISSIQSIISSGLENNISADGGMKFWSNSQKSDVCVNGMFLNYASYFVTPDERFYPLIDMLLQARMKDGGWNCRFRNKAVHSSFDTTLSVLEGLWEYQTNGGNYRLDEIIKAETQAVEFLLEHYLYLSHRTRQVVDAKMSLFSYPTHWKYDVLKSLSHLAERKLAWDDRLQPAVDLLLSRMTSDGKWLLQNTHPGKVHFQMEKCGQPSYWNTLRALRVIRQFCPNISLNTEAL